MLWQRKGLFIADEKTKQGEQSKRTEKWKDCNKKVWQEDRRKTVGKIVDKPMPSTRLLHFDGPRHGFIPWIFWRWTATHSAFSAVAIFCLNLPIFSSNSRARPQQQPNGILTSEKDLKLHGQNCTVAVKRVVVLDD